MNWVYEFLLQFVGVYQIQEQTVYLPIESIDPVSGNAFISGYTAYQVTATGIASLDIPWLISALFVLYLAYAFIYKPIWHVYKELTTVRGQQN